MALITCPECGTKISESSKFCIYCGYQSDNENSEDNLYEKLEVMTSYSFDLEVIEDEHLYDISYTIVDQNDMQILDNIFSDYERISNSFPLLAKAIDELAKQETKLVGVIPNFIKEKLKTGEWNFSKDSDGMLLASLRDSKGIVKNIRLEQETVPKDVLSVIDNFSTKATMNQLLTEIKTVNESLWLIEQNIHNDRIAEAEASLEIINQVKHIKDSRIRETMLMNTIHSSVSAKRKLMRSFVLNYNSIKQLPNKNFNLLSKSDYISNKANNALLALKSITNIVQSEAMAYSILGEFEAGKKTIFNFYKFLDTNNLNNRDTLLLINENLKNKDSLSIEKLISFSNSVNRFISNEEQLVFLAEIEEEEVKYEFIQEKK